PVRQPHVDVGVQIEAAELFGSIDTGLIEVRNAERVRAPVAHTASAADRVIGRRRSDVEVSARIAEPNRSDGIEDDFRNAVLVRPLVLVLVRFRLARLSWPAPSALVDFLSVEVVAAIASRPVGDVPAKNRPIVAELGVEVESQRLTQLSSLGLDDDHAV